MFNVYVCMLSIVFLMYVCVCFVFRYLNVAKSGINFFNNPLKGFIATRFEFLKIGLNPYYLLINLTILL